MEEVTVSLPKEHMAVSLSGAGRALRSSSSAAGGLRLAG